MKKVPILAYFVLLAIIFKYVKTHCIIGFLVGTIAILAIFIISSPTIKRNEWEEH